MTTTEQKALTTIEEQTGLRFRVKRNADGTLDVTEAANPYYEPSPQRFRIELNGTIVPLDRDGFPVDDDEEDF